MGTFTMCPVEADINAYQADIDAEEERQEAVEAIHDNLWEEWIEGGLEILELPHVTLMNMYSETPEITEYFVAFVQAKSRDDRKEAAYKLASLMEEIASDAIYDVAVEKVDEVVDDY